MFKTISLYFLVFCGFFNFCHSDQLVWQGIVSALGRKTDRIPLNPGEEYYAVARGVVNLGRIAEWGNENRLNDACYMFRVNQDPIYAPVLKNSYQFRFCSGTYHSEHVYQSLPFRGNDRPLWFWVEDTNYGDNSGQFLVEVYRVFSPTPLAPRDSPPKPNVETPFQEKDSLTNVFVMDLVTAYDFVGQNKNLIGDGRRDSHLQLQLSYSAAGSLTNIYMGETLVLFQISTLDGRVKWDTNPKSNAWLIAVVDSGKIINYSDGSVRWVVPYITNRPDVKLDLYVQDDGTLASGEHLKLTFRTLTGKTYTFPIVPKKAVIKHMY